jgi:hypothetical protein
MGIAKDRYLAFDIETAKDVPGDSFVWRPHRPLGISCAATLASDSPQPILWHGKRLDGSPAPRMSTEEAGGLVNYLTERASEGYKILTWNGLGFDFDVLAEESRMVEECKECALGHVDMMFQAFCLLGFPIGLDKAAQGMGVPGKPHGMSGAKAPVLWAEGRFDEVLSYVAQDVRIAMGIAETSLRRGRLNWIKRSGGTGALPLPGGWMTVRAALKLPSPDTSWMSSPIPRSDFAGWLRSV